MHYIALLVKRNKILTPKKNSFIEGTMISNEYSEDFAETLDILNHTRKEDVLKISPKFIEYLKSNASQTYISKLDHSKEIKDMDLSIKTKAILAIIYKKFWCTEEEAKDFDNKLKINEKNYQLELEKNSIPIIYLKIKN